MNSLRSYPALRRLTTTMLLNRSASDHRSVVAAVASWCVSKLRLGATRLTKHSLI